MSEHLIFPTKILDQHLVVLGKTGAGKSSALRHVVEYLLRRKKRVCVIDPKGDWWGLKVSADGKSEGFPVITFGSFKGDVKADIPINAQSGKHLAELVASGNRPCVIGLGGWMTSHLVEFWIGFASALFSHNSGELYLIGDEFHNFAPKGKIMDPQAGKCLHWSNRLLSEGRGLGLVCLIASQRPQKVHNDTLTSCETLVAMRVVHKSDRKAVQDWIEGCGDMDRGKEVLNSLAGMERGEAFVWSPEIEFGPERLKFPMFETFDSFAPPQLQKKVVASDWSNVDLEAVKEKLASVIEEAKQNDPKELKGEIARLKAELRKAQAGSAANAPAKTETKTVEVPVFSKEDRKLFDDVGSSFLKVCDQLEKVAGVVNDSRTLIAMLSARIEQRLKLSAKDLHATAAPIRRTVPAPAPRPQRAISAEATGAANGSLPKAERAILRVLANYPEGKAKREIGVIAGYRHTGGGFGNAIGALRSKGYIEGGEVLRITESGMEAYGPVDPLPSGSELFAYWQNHPDLGRAEREVLRVLYEAGGEALTKEEVAARTVSDKGTAYEPQGGGFGNAVGRLRTFELIEGRGELRAAKEFFE